MLHKNKRKTKIKNNTTYPLRWEVINPSKEIILKPRLNPMGHEGDIMHKTTSPSIESWPFMSEDLCIHEYPYVPTGCEDHFGEERMVKISVGLNGKMIHIRSQWPAYLKVVPHSNTDSTLKTDGIYPP